MPSPRAHDAQRLAAFGFGCSAGIVPWLAIGVYLHSPGSTSSATPPGFVYGILISLFVFFDVFAVNQG